MDSGFSRAGGSLDSVRRVADRLGALPQSAHTAIIGGTNGKGSTAVTLERLLQASGGRVGTTISPHLDRFNERIRIEGQEVDDDQLAIAMESVLRVAGEERLSYFDYATLAAILMFKQSNVEYAVLEVGMGGRLDATNVVDADVAVITNIAIDHQAVLGPDRNSIGREKAGIFRRSKTVVVGESNPPESLVARAEELDCKILVLGRDYFAEVLPRGNISLHLHVNGSEERFVTQAPKHLHLSNFCAACQAASCLLKDMSSQFLESALQVKLPGRRELASYGGRKWLLDVAHNPAAAEELSRWIREHFPEKKVHCIFAAKREKDVIGMMNAMLSIVTTMAMTELGDGFTTEMRHLCNKCSMITPVALEQAVSYLIESSEEGDLVVVFGSFALVAKIRKELQAC